MKLTNIVFVAETSITKFSFFFELSESAAVTAVANIWRSKRKDLDRLSGFVESPIGCTVETKEPSQSSA
jgi:hypothetical protein